MHVIIALRSSRHKATGLPLRRIERKSKQPDDATRLHHLLHIQHTMGNHAVGRMIQAKLKIGQLGDKFEQEADRVADVAMRVPEPQSQRQAEEKEKICTILKKKQSQTKPLGEHHASQYLDKKVYVATGGTLFEWMLTKAQSKKKVLV